MELALAVKLAVLMAQSGTLPYLPTLLSAWGIHLTPAQLAALERLLALLACQDGATIHLQPLTLGPDGWLPWP